MLDNVRVLQIFKIKKGKYTLKKKKKQYVCAHIWEAMLVTHVPPLGERKYLWRMPLQ